MALCAKDVMTGQVIAAREDMPVAEFVALLKKHGISGTPVLDGDDHLVGVVSATDVLLHCQVFEDDWQMDSDFHTHVGGESGLIAEDFDDADVRDMKVGDIMSIEAITAQMDLPIRELAGLMCEENIRRVIILQGTKLAGIVSMTDILRAIVDGRLA